MDGKKRWLHPSAEFIWWSKQGPKVANFSLIVVDVLAMVKAVMTTLRSCRAEAEAALC